MLALVASVAGNAGTGGWQLAEHFSFSLVYSPGNRKCRRVRSLQVLTNFHGIAPASSGSGCTGWVEKMEIPQVEPCAE